MSKKQPTASKFSYQPVTPLPKLSTIKEEWDLKRHYYKSEKDPRIEKDIVEAETAITAFAKKYRSGTWTKSVSGIVAATKAYLDLISLQGERPLYYLFYRKELNAGDQVAGDQHVREHAVGLPELAADGPEHHAQHGAVERREEIVAAHNAKGLSDIDHERGLGFVFGLEHGEDPGLGGDLDEDVDHIDRHQQTYQWPYLSVVDE